MPAALARGDHALNPTPEPLREMLLYPEGLLLVLCLIEPYKVGNAAVRDRLIAFHMRLHMAVNRRRRLGDTRRFGEIAIELCDQVLIERAMGDARSSSVGTEVFMCRVLDEQIAHLA